MQHFSFNSLKLISAETYEEKKNYIIVVFNDIC